MNVQLSDTIKRLRRKKNLTQEDLADALGVTAQAVSKWETDVSCPDISLLPALAVTLGVSMDELFGMDDKALEAKLDEYDRLCDAEPDLDARIQLTRAYMAELPPDCWSLHTDLLQLYVKKGVEFTDARREEMRHLCHFILEHSPVGSWQTAAIQRMVMVESDEPDENGKTPVDVWLAMLGNEQRITPEDALIERYSYRGEVEKYNQAIQEDIFRNLKKIFCYDFCKRDRVTFKNPASRVAGQKTILQIIDCLRDPTVEVDAWLDERAFAHVRLSAGAFGMGDRETGYAALEKAVELYLVMATLPERTRLTFNHPTLDLIDRIVGVTFPPNDYALSDIHRCIANPNGWEWFNGVREEERYRALVEKIEAAMEAIKTS